MPKFIRQGNNTLIGNNTFTGTNTFSGLLVASGGVTGNVTGNVTGGITLPTEAVTAETEAVSASESGKVYVQTRSSTTCTFTLPAAAAGLTYTFVCGHADSEILITPQAGDAIVGKTHAAENGTGIAPAAGTGIKNTAATNVVGDHCTLVALDATTWYMTSVAGVWASQ
ncbi:MAG TPA: hypothetical protein VJ836_00765 [Candidatus Saccharimonadales bacterium]|nr:hypothetical protein [Candidatus Saccharimonadales bacterium]